MSKANPMAATTQMTHWTGVILSLLGGALAASAIGLIENDTTLRSRRAKPAESGVLEYRFRTTHGTSQQTLRENELPRRFGLQRRTGLRRLERDGGQAHRQTRSRREAGAHQADYRRGRCGLAA